MMNNGGRRFLSTDSPSRGAAVVATQDETERMPAPEITKDEYKDMVNTYGLPTDMWDKPAFGMYGQTPKRKGRIMPKKHFLLAPRIAMTPEQEAKASGERVVLEPVDELHSQRLDKMYWYLRQHRGTISLNTLWKLYQRLQAPRLRYMDNYMIRAFFAHLTWIEHAHTAPRTRRRFFTLLEECIGEQIQLTPVEWGAAMHLAGRAVRIGTDNEVKDAIELWLEMEQSGVKANNVVFNILFDVAVKAGRFALADTIYNELTSRGMELDRYFRVSMIYYAGAKGDGDAVRKAFNDMVNASEIIDTAIMNCVILSFIRAGEPSAAEHVFLKMKALHEAKFGSRGPIDWRARRRLATLLTETGRQLRKDSLAHENTYFGTQFSRDAHREKIQEASPIAPDAHTYRLLLRYHTRVSGELNRVQELLAEKKGRGFHVHGSVYLNIFSACIIHGGYAHSTWTPKVLESFWKDFLEASSEPNAEGFQSTRRKEAPPVDEDDDTSGNTAVDPFDEPQGLVVSEVEEDPPISEEHKAPYFTESLVVTVLRAFHKCIGTPRMLEVWDEIKLRWKDCGSEEMMKIESRIEDMQRWDL